MLILVLIENVQNILKSFKIKIISRFKFYRKVFIDKFILLQHAPTNKNLATALKTDVVDRAVARGGKGAMPPPRIHFAPPPPIFET